MTTPKYGLCILDGQKAFTVHGEYPIEHTEEVHYRINTMLHVMADHISAVVTTMETRRRMDDVASRKNWRFVSNNKNPSPSQILRHDQTSLTGYSIDYEPAFYVHGKKEFEWNGNSVKIEPSCFEAFSPNGWGLTATISDGLAYWSEQHKPKKVFPDTWFKHNERLKSESNPQVEFSKNWLDVTEVLMVGESMFGDKTSRYLMSELVRYRTENNVLEPLRFVCIRDMFTDQGDIATCHDVIWINSSNLFRGNAMNVVGLPVHIKSSSTPNNQSISNMQQQGTRVNRPNGFEVSKAYWMRKLETIQYNYDYANYGAEDKKQRGIILKAVTKYGHLVEDTMSEHDYLVEYDSFIKDEYSRVHYNVIERGNCVSFINMSRGVPPVLNPYGLHLIPGRGELPFYGPNHTTMVLFVLSDVPPVTFQRTPKYILVNVFKRVGGDEFSRSPRGLSEASEGENKDVRRVLLKLWQGILSGTETNNKPPLSCFGAPMCLYEGYYPELRATKHAWVESTVFMVEVCIDPPKVYYTQPYDGMLLELSKMVPKSLGHLYNAQQDLQSLILYLDQDQLVSFLPKDAADMLPLFGIKTGKDLIAWMEDIHEVKDSFVDQILDPQVTLMVIGSKLGAFFYRNEENSDHELFKIMKMLYRIIRLPMDVFTTPGLNREILETNFKDLTEFEIEDLVAFNTLYEGADENDMQIYKLNEREGNLIDQVITLCDALEENKESASSLFHRVELAICILGSEHNCSLLMTKNRECIHQTVNTLISTHTSRFIRLMEYICGLDCINAEQCMMRKRAFTDMIHIFRPFRAVGNERVKKHFPCPVKYDKIFYNLVRWKFPLSSRKKSGSKV